MLPRQVHHQEGGTASGVWAVSASTQCWSKPSCRGIVWTDLLDGVIILPGSRWSTWTYCSLSKGTLLFFLPAPKKSVITVSMMANSLTTLLIFFFWFINFSHRCYFWTGTMFFLEGLFPPRIQTENKTVGFLKGLSIDAFIHRLVCSWSHNLVYNKCYASSSWVVPSHVILLTEWSCQVFLGFPLCV